MLKNLKKLISLVLVLALSVVISLPAFASTTESSANGRISTAKIAKSISATIGDKNTKISKVLTYDEIVDQIAKDNAISKDEATTLVKSNFSKNSVVLAETATYRTLSETVPIWSNYQPTIRFYCETSEDSDGDFHGILRILNVSLNRVYNRIAKQYSGTLYTNLEDANRIYWVLDGDFYDYGTTTVSAGGSIGIGGVATLNFSVSYASNYFGTAYEEGYLNW
jgi:hypothetical protein